MNKSVVCAIACGFALPVFAQSAAFRCEGFRARPSQGRHIVTGVVEEGARRYATLKDCVFWPINTDSCEPENVVNQEQKLSYEGKRLEERLGVKLETYRIDNSKYNYSYHILLDLDNLTAAEFSGYVKSNNLSGPKYEHLKCRAL